MCLCITIYILRFKSAPLSGGCLRLGFPAKTCEMKVLRQLAIRYYRTPFLFYRGKRSRLRNSQLIPLLQNTSSGDGATASLLSF